MPQLLDLLPTDLPSPLAQFQAARATKEGTCQLISSIAQVFCEDEVKAIIRGRNADRIIADVANTFCPDRTAAVVQKADAIWPSLPANLQAIVKMPGVIDAAAFLTSRRRCEGEVFAIELLKNPVNLERRSDGTVEVTINRKNVTDILISTEGKTHTVEATVKDANRTALETLDREIHNFLAARSGAIIESSRQIDLPSLGIPLRRGSGGVLSIVEHKDESGSPCSSVTSVPTAGTSLSGLRSGGGPGNLVVRYQTSSTRTIPSGQNRTRFSRIMHRHTPNLAKSATRPVVMHCCC
jgi:hypothetical protein